MFLVKGLRELERKIEREREIEGGGARKSANQYSTRQGKAR